ncbi:MAG: SDR family oxidoreductase [Pseudohongiellaceae bacterium]|nr:SDR family oxidoreductase [Pseudohongiellaceae bacterium]
MSETILITGGTGKFGRVFVRHFLNKGFNVIFTSTDLERAEEFKESFHGVGDLSSYICDFTTKEAVSNFMQELSKSSRKINHLINNARSLSSLAVNHQGRTDRDCFLNEYLMDVVVPYELSMELASMNGSKLRTVINIGSQYGVVAATPRLYDDHLIQSPIQYGVAKAALMHLTKELAVRLAKSHVRVNCVAYGGVEGRVDVDFRKRYAELVPTGKMLNESEITGPVDFLIQESSSSVTGHTLIADGGWTLW